MSSLSGWKCAQDVLHMFCGRILFSLCLWFDMRNEMQAQMIEMYKIINKIEEIARYSYDLILCMDRLGRVQVLFAFC